MMRHGRGVLLLLLLGGCSSDPAVQLDGVTPPPDSQILLEGLRADAGSPDARPTDGSSTTCTAGPALLAKVDPARMLADLNALTASERASAAGQAKAAAYLKQQLAPLGLPVREQSYSYGGSTYVNLEVTLAGELADRFVFTGAHYDADAISPGADDDGSGAVAVLEMARVLASCKPKRTVRFLFFSNEEAGTVGSTKYVKSIATEAPPAKVAGFLSLDMIGYARANEDLDLATRPAYASLVDAVATSVTKWSALQVKKVVNDQCG
jgi:hypothetical protein